MQHEAKADGKDQSLRPSAAVEIPASCPTAGAEIPAAADKFNQVNQISLDGWVTGESPLNRTAPTSGRPLY